MLPHDRVEEWDAGHVRPDVCFVTTPHECSHNECLAEGSPGHQTFPIQKMNNNDDEFDWHPGP